MTPQSNTMTSSKHSKIVGIQFSLLSPDEIRRMSVAEITSRDTYDNNKPKIGGLFDPRMGVLEHGLICPTDGLDYINTPGYFGHIELARPVFYAQYVSTIIKVLRCVCFKCSKLLINKEKHHFALNMPNEERWQYVFQHGNSGKIKVCGKETTGGCGCKQPTIRKEGYSTLNAEWENKEEENTVVRVTPELALKILHRISDVDVDFMGFSSKWSRPDWMICQVLSVPPPAVRPSVKHDAQQRSEDDITHIIVNIIKTNKMLMEKMKNNASENVIEDLTNLLQYYVATQVDNKIPGVAAVAQRSGRPLKSIKERLNGKTGRVRGNLMGKRVDFSARSVITADPNISIRELGIPEKVAKNITKPVVVNEKNKKFLMKLIENGPNVWPGAKILEKKNNGPSISLRYASTKNIKLENGDIVHRHMMDGDGILFNRQPTLHRMSMMCHRAKIMKQGNTFRMNVADTKPYNADFDGDEMNLHMPQDMESESELLNLAAVPHQLISPANNSTIVGIFQDSLLGAFQITRDDITFTKREAMNILMSYDNVDPTVFDDKDAISSFDILSQIVPPLSLQYKTKHFGDDEDYEKSNHVLEITNGKMKRGQLEKSALGSRSKGILQRVCNDFGNDACSKFIDDLQNIVTDYMKVSSYSVGISDLISNQETKDKIGEVLKEKRGVVNEIIDKTHLGLFENDTGNTNLVEFESQLSNILNKATSQAGKIGLQSLNKNNRFVNMVNAGSKGSDLNISFMISCLGQQTVNGKRIPYGFEHRTLPHFNKYDDSLSSRGFVESSYIGGLTPSELFFHAMGGRVGLIDTAVKTSQTGYIQRRLIKGMEDLKVEYDMTVRNNKGKIVQFSYGDNNMDTVKVEEQHLPYVSMTIDDVYNHFHIYTEKDNKILTKPFTKTVQKNLKKEQEECKQYCLAFIEKTLEFQNKIVENVWKMKNESKVFYPVAFKYIINNIQHQCNLSGNSLVDISPLETFKLLESTINKLNQLHYCKTNDMFMALFMYYMSPKQLLYIKRFNRSALTLLLDTIVLQYKKSIVAPGEMVGMIAAQSIGEPTTQMTLNTFHFAGVASKSNVTRGVPRIEEILSLTENIKNPSLTVELRKEDRTDRQKAMSIMYMIENTKFGDLIKNIQLCFDPKEDQTLVEQDNILLQKYRKFESLIDGCDGIRRIEDESGHKSASKWIIRIEMNDDEMLEKNITMDDIHYTLTTMYKDEIDCVFSDYNDSNLVFRIRLHKMKSKATSNNNEPESLDQSDEIFMLKSFQSNLMENVVLRGVKNIKKVMMRKVQHVIRNDSAYENQDAWVLDTDGTNLQDILALDYIDCEHTFSNNIVEMYNVLGIEAARQSIFNELVDVIEFDSTYINSHHLNLLCDRMTYNTKMTSIFRHGINNDDIGPLAKASFEETPEMFLKAARHAELDIMKGVSANVMCGQEGNFGTSAFKVVVDEEAFANIEVDDTMMSLNQQLQSDIDDLDIVDEPSDDMCSLENIKIENNAKHIVQTSMGDDDESYMPDF